MNKEDFYLGEAKLTKKEIEAIKPYINKWKVCPPHLFDRLEKRRAGCIACTHTSMVPWTEEYSFMHECWHGGGGSYAPSRSNKNSGKYIRWE
jgi:hypothetical protein